MLFKTFIVFMSIYKISNIGAQDFTPTIDLPPDLTTDSLNNFLDPILAGLNNPEETNCNRICEDGLSKICYLKMHVENYQAMGAACRLCAFGVESDCLNPQCITTDGIEKNVASINRKIPGPLIQACKNDLIVVDVYNKMHSDSLSIHWHGMFQKNTQYMDGVPMVTQCPINPNNRFRYTYWAREDGTHFYHSHSGIQRYNGVFGGLVIRKPLAHNAASTLYDMDEHVIILSDWSHNAPEMFYVGLPTRKPGLSPEAVLINGKGKFLDPTTQTYTPTPYETLYVTGGLRYRIRIINAGSAACPMQMQIPYHKMAVISVDGNDVQPVPFDTLVIGSGERYDVIIETNQPPGMYWIEVKLVGVCTAMNIFQRAILFYGSAEDKPKIPIGPESLIIYPRGDTLNDVHMPCKPPSNWCIKDLKALETTFDWFQKINQRIYLSFSMKSLNSLGFFNDSYDPFLNSNTDFLILGTMNNLSFHPPTHPILSQNDENDMSKFCHDNTPRPEHCDSMQICVCTHVIDIQQGDFVELVLIDEDRVMASRAHPIHLHGYKFAVVGQDRIATAGSLTIQDIIDYESQGLLLNDNPFPALKDTITVPSHGYAVVRFEADNPGAWMLHCHVEYHMVYGMSAVIRVGGEVPPAPFNFPRCGDF